MAWSVKQEEAISVRGKNILVAAAAGSGKTSVLVERIIRRITDTADPVDIDKILVVTFTNAAAAEMRSRIGAALTDALKQQPEARHIERQLVLLGSAAISTIHSFCQTMVKQNFHLLDIDPKFRIGGEAEINLMKADILEALFEECYSAGQAEFLNFAEHYGSEHSDEALYDLILGLYDFSRSHPWPVEWLKTLDQRFCFEEGADLEETPWPALLREKIVLELEAAGQLLTALMREAALPGNPDVYVHTFEEDRRLLEELIAAAHVSWHCLGEKIRGCEFGKIASAPKDTPKEVRDYFQKKRQKVKEKIKYFKDQYFSRSPEELISDMRSVQPLVKAMTSLVEAFAERFALAKAAKGLLDFNDLEHFCLKVLLDKDARPFEIKPSAVALALRERFAEVMIDEYQDTNGVQETILQLVASPDKHNLFVVGDVKQSIYRFRLAEPALFMQKYREYPLLEDCTRIDLAQNFRSRKVVLDAVNFLFGQLMTERAAELQYGDEERLNPGPDYAPCEGPLAFGPVELCLVDGQITEAGSKETEEPDGEAESTSEETIEEELSGFELEARLIARRILSMMENACKVYDKSSKTYRELEWRDMVILLRSVKGKANVLLEVLRDAGIPVYAEVDGGYFQEIEVQVMLSLLSIIDNPRQDIHLAGVLRSPLYGLTAAELAEVRLTSLTGDLWGAVLDAFGEGLLEEGLKQKINLFASQLAKWRDLSRRSGVPELIWQIYRESGFYDYVGGMTGGALRQANLRTLYDRARQYEATNFRGLFRFLRFLDRMQDKGSDLAVARTLGESENVVRIMSIHKSKGLEFPVVFIADLGKNFNLQDSRGLLLCHKELGIGPYVIEPELRYRYPTLARLAIAHKLNMETKAEELRVLYVALTRAREKLILVGSVKNIEKKLEEWAQCTDSLAIPLPDGLIAGAKSYLDWLCPAISRHKQSEILYCHGAGLAGTFQNDPSEWLIKIYKREELAKPGEEALADAPLMASVQKLEAVALSQEESLIAEVLDWQYEGQAAVGKPAKLSVTEIKRRFEDLQGNDSEPEGAKLFEAPPAILRPQFIKRPGKMTAAEVGTILHTVMQHLDYMLEIDEAGVATQLKRMVDREILLAEQAAAVAVKSIAAFWQSSIGQRMQKALYIRREMPFSLMLPAGRFYPELDGTGEEIFVQGIIDVLFDDGDGLVLLDYKTDYQRDSSEIAKKYDTQLNLYAEAVEIILKRKVKEKYLYLFSTGELVNMQR